MVQYYSGSPVAHPMVNIYCGGFLLGTYGQAPDLVTGFDTAGFFGGGDMWRVVDVQTLVDGTGVTVGVLPFGGQATEFFRGATLEFAALDIPAIIDPSLYTGYWDNLAILAVPVN